MADHLSDYVNDLPAEAEGLNIDVAANTSSGASLEVTEDRPTTGRTDDEILMEVCPPDKSDDPPEEDAPEAAQEVEGETPEAEPTTEPAADPDARAASLQALKRDGWTDELISGITDAQLESFGDLAKARQSKSDNDARLRAETAKDSSATSEDSRVPETQDAPTIDVKELVAPIVEELGEDAGAAVVPLVQSVVEQATKGLRDTVAKLDSALQQSQSMLYSSLTEQARGALTSEYPDLSKPEVWASVKARQESLLKSGAYNDPAEVLLHACRIELPRGATKTQRTPKRKGSQPTGGRRSTRDQSKMSADDYVLNQLDAGATSRQARERQAARND